MRLHRHGNILLSHVARWARQASAANVCLQLLDSEGQVFDMCSSFGNNSDGRRATVFQARDSIPKDVHTVPLVFTALLFYLVVIGTPTPKHSLGEDEVADMDRAYGLERVAMLTVATRSTLLALANQHSIYIPAGQ